MLPVYRATQFLSVYDKKNRTKPWLVLVEAENDVKPYVVKLFDSKEIDLHDRVLKEVLGNLLAKEFDLPAPKAALIDLDEDFVSTIRDLDIIDELESKDYRLKFGTEEKKGVLPFNPNILSSRVAKQIVDIDTVFAFDCFIRNIDRNRHNPNLLANSNEVYLIDHEFAFHIDEKSSDEIVNQWFLQDRFYTHHVFYKYLKDSFKDDKRHCFDTFEDYLRNFNLNVLKRIFEQLKMYGFTEKNHNLIGDYIEKMKSNSSTFVQILKGKING